MRQLTRAEPRAIRPEDVSAVGVMVPALIGAAHLHVEAELAVALFADHDVHNIRLPSLHYIQNHRPQNEYQNRPNDHVTGTILERQTFLASLIEEIA
jgi:hypothetical protein